MRQAVVLMVLMAVAGAAPGQDWEGDLVGVDHNVDGMIGVAWDSQYIWRGFDVFDDESAVHILGDLNFSGFGLSAAGHRANSSGFEDRERWDYTLYYQNGAFLGEPYATNFRFGWVYYNFPELNEGESIDLQEGQAVLSWPNLLPIKGLCPSYAVVKMWPAKSGSRLPDSSSGWLHILMLDYGFTIPGLLPDIPEHLIRLHSEIVFNDGVTMVPERRNPDQDWSHAVFGASTDLAFGPGDSIVFTPAVYYQVTLEQSVNPDESEFWASLSLKYMF